MHKTRLSFAKTNISHFITFGGGGFFVFRECKDSKVCVFVDISKLIYFELALPSLKAESPSSAK